MATATFNKNITLDQEAAERFAAIFDAPPRFIPDMSDKVKWLNKEELECLMQRRSEKS